MMRLFQGTTTCGRRVLTLNWNLGDAIGELHEIARGVCEGELIEASVTELFRDRPAHLQYAEHMSNGCSHKQACFYD